MTGFISSHPLAVSWLILFSLLNLMLVMYLTGIVLVRYPSVGRALGLAAWTLLIAVIYVILSDIHFAIDRSYPQSGLSLWADRTIPLSAFYAVISASSVCGLALWNAMYRIRKNEINAGSIKDAVDSLPVGMAFYRLNGTTVLANRRMYEIARSLTHTPMRTFLRFEEQLLDPHGPFPRIADVLLTSSGETLIEMPDHTVYRFTIREFLSGGELFREMTAVDVTRLYELSVEFEQKNRELSERRRRLHALLEELTSLRQEEEKLAMKMRLHEEFGTAVSATKRCLASSRLDIPELQRVWERTARRFLRVWSPAPKSPDAFRQLKDACRSLGCDLRLDGALPDSPELSYLIISILREAAINAARHGEANRIDATLSKKSGGCLLTVTDNGKGAAGPLREGGGLSDIRKRIEHIGGMLKISTENGVRLTVYLPEDATGGNYGKDNDCG